MHLDYVKGRDGPFANNLGHVLKNIEGHFVSGFGDGSRAVQANEPLIVLPGAVEAAAGVVGEVPDLEHRIESVLKLVDGCESAYDMELLTGPLASMVDDAVAWVARNSRHRLVSNPHTGHVAEVLDPPLTAATPSTDEHVWGQSSIWRRSTGESATGRKRIYSGHLSECPATVESYPESYRRPTKTCEF